MTARSGSRARAPRPILVLACLAAIAGAVRADEGMWPFDALPMEQLAATYGFTPSPAWIENLRLASVRFNNGGSGSFVSASGLILTNHHVGSDCIQQISTAEHDYNDDGFIAARPEDEKACPDLELNVLMGSERVTDRIEGAVRRGMDPAAAAAARDAAIASLEKSCGESTGLRCEVEASYSGAAYELFRYRRYTDVRLVLAPEAKAAQFGGDPDNFQYPRFDLDFCFFRAYDGGKPAGTPHHLRFSTRGVRGGDLTFVSGHPGSTSRGDTLAQLRFARDVEMPSRIADLRRMHALLRDYAARGPEEARIAGERILGIENSLKVRTGLLQGLEDPKRMGLKESDEKALRDSVASDPTLREAWSRIEAAEQVYGSFYQRYWLFEAAPDRHSDLLGYARRVLRLAAEREKPDGKRLRDFHDADIPNLERELGSAVPVYDGVEEILLRDYLETLARTLGATDAAVKEVLGGRSPADVARTAVAGTSLRDPRARLVLAKQNPARLAASKDPMLRLAARLDAEARRVRKRYEDQVEAVEIMEGSQIARARFAARDNGSYPDANFTLRLAFGPVTGYVENGRAVHCETDFRGLFARSEEHGGKAPFDLPQRYLEGRERLNLDAPLNFVHTADTTGGNSGSPVVDRAGELVGLLFDGNIQSIANDIGYREELERSVSVDAGAILEVLRKLYDADALLREIEQARQ